MARLPVLRGNSCGKIPEHRRTASSALTAAASSYLHRLGDEAAYRDYRDRYRDMATSLGFEGHMAWAEAMP